MSSDSLERKPVRAWFALALLFFYLAGTLWVAIAARPPAPDEALGDWHAKFVPLVEKLPGASEWQWTFGLDEPPATARITGLPLPYIIDIGLASLMALCGYFGQRNKARNAKDAEIVREERLKQRTRERLGMEGRR